jgi:hypothetical protein
VLLTNVGLGCSHDLTPRVLVARTLLRALIRVVDRARKVLPNLDAPRRERIHCAMPLQIVGGTDPGGRSDSARIWVTRQRGPAINREADAPPHYYGGV